MATLLDTLRSLATPELLGQASALLGEPQDNVSRGLGSAFSTILAGLLGESNDPGGMRQIVDLLGDRTLDTSTIGSIAGLLGAGGLAKSPATDLGSRFLQLLFGPRMDSVAGAVGSSAGVRTSSASTL